MPNWVSNQLDVSGSEADIARFREQANRSYEIKTQTFSAEPGATFVTWVNATEENPVMSFWNFLRPEDDILDQYWGEEERERSLEDRLQHKGNHWYDWNVRNWGVKWDASQVTLHDGPDTQLCYTFETPWSPPEGVFIAMVRQFPTLEFTLRSCEEQGWGVEYLGQNGEVSVVEEWDIPETHQERVKLWGECWVCDSYEQHPEHYEEYLDDDCRENLGVTV